MPPPRHSFRSHRHYLSQVAHRSAPTAQKAINWGGAVFGLSFLGVLSFLAESIAIGAGLFFAMLLVLFYLGSFRVARELETNVESRGEQVLAISSHLEGQIAAAHARLQRYQDRLLLFTKLEHLFRTARWPEDDFYFKGRMNAQLEEAVRILVEHNEPEMAAQFNELRLSIAALEYPSAAQPLSEADEGRAARARAEYRDLVITVQRLFSSCLNLGSPLFVDTPEIRKPW